MTRTQPEVRWLLDLLAPIVARQPEPVPHQRYARSRTVTLGDGDSLDIVVPAGADDEALVQVDDGSGNAPATYDLAYDVWAPATTDYRRVSLRSGTTARSLTDPLFEDRFRYTVTNQSGSAATYRLRVVATATAADRAHPLRRVDRDTSRVFETDSTLDMATPVRSRVGELQAANYVGAALVDESTTAIGTEYDHRIERTVGLRIEGYSGDYGHVDVAGDAGVPFHRLVEQILHPIRDNRTFPSVGRRRTDYTDILLENEQPAERDYGDYHRHDVDVVFRGYRELP